MLHSAGIHVTADHQSRLFKNAGYVKKEQLSCSEAHRQRWQRHPRPGCAHLLLL
jgi:hypothetical protein